VSETALEVALRLMQHTKAISDEHFEIRIPRNELSKRVTMTVSESWISFAKERKENLTAAQTFLHRMNEISGSCTNLATHCARIDRFRVPKKRWGREENLKLIIRDFVHEAYSLHEIVLHFGNSGKDLISDKALSTNYLKCFQKLCSKLKKHNAAIYDYRNYLVHRELGLPNPFSVLDTLSIGVVLYQKELNLHFENEILNEQKKWTTAFSHFVQCTANLVSKIIETNDAHIDSGHFNFA
jgi:hypothetical protein